MTGTSIAKAQAGTSTVDPAARALAQIALDPSTGPGPAAMAEMGFTSQHVDLAVAAIDESLVPAKIADPGMESKQAKRLRDNLGVIGRKVRPDMDGAQAKDWVAAIMMALTNLPYRVSVEASAEAVHTPFEFLSEVEKEIRRLAVDIDIRFQMAKRRLDIWRRKIMEPAPEALPRSVPMVWDDAAFTELAATPMGLAILRMGIAGGWIEQRPDGSYGYIEKEDDDA